MLKMFIGLVAVMLAGCASTGLEASHPGLTQCQKPAVANPRQGVSDSQADAEYRAYLTCVQRGYEAVSGQSR